MTQLRLHGLRGLAIVISLLAVTVVLIQLVWCVQIWLANNTVVETHSWGKTASHGGIARMPFVYSTLGWFFAVLVAGVLLIVWLWRARANSEMLCPAKHRLGRGWIVGAWFTPILSFVFPAILVEDVVRASDPAAGGGRSTLKGVPHSGLVWAWWIVWAFAWVSVVVERVNFQATNEYHREIDEAADAWTSWAWSYTAMTLLFGLAAGLLIAILVRVEGWQARRDPVF
ncbi:DUF4328 domain-containing protein [Nocardia sp. XZ_19_385]|uniref:DUF4328 domain-containing protein n=1 Tax=Nocardia sp. XZ_19_385 TaxID=2769488 RepID=UPI001890460C|nr:DUF4328 domain-containing protein [Nocardia sp. XZ_19_385]